MHSSRRLKAGRSKYVLFLDDDIVAEPESILRAVTFADLARRPSIVGGHMFSIYAKAQLHSFGEIINRNRFWWMSPEVGTRSSGTSVPATCAARAGCTAASTWTSTRGSCA